MVTPYTQNLARVTAVSAGEAPLFTVPSGFVYVVRSITAALYGSGPPYLGLGGFAIMVPLNNPIFSALSPIAKRNVTYTWEGRIALSVSQQLLYQAYDSGWSFNVTGYQFAT